VLRKFPQKNKIYPLPVGVSATWRYRKNRMPYFEYMVSMIVGGKMRTKHFYVGVEPLPIVSRIMREKAISFRKFLEELP